MVIKSIESTSVLYVLSYMADHWNSREWGGRRGGQRVANDFPPINVEQGTISKINSVSFPDRGRIRMKRNFLICPSLALFHGFLPANRHRVLVCARERSHWWKFSSFSEYS